jgi:serine/threonine-protein kinase
LNPIQVIDGKYRIVRQLGEGGMGAVYEARNLGTGRRVAVKVIVPEVFAKNSPESIAGITKRFQREARAAGAIESRHIAQVLDTGVDAKGGFPYMVIEYLEGEDVSQAKKRLGGALPPDLALRIASQACAGLQKAHDSQVVHRDIKPANLYLAKQEGGEILVKLLDFGIAKISLDRLLSAENAALTHTGMLLGSPLYMSPEQAQNAKDMDHRTDIWSLGVVLYECLAGLPPAADCNSLGSLILKICAGPSNIQDRAAWVTPEVAEIVHKALAVDPAMRFQSAAAMGDAIRAVLGGGHAIDPSMLVPLSSPVRSTRAPRHVGSLAYLKTVPAPESGNSAGTVPSTSTTAGFSQPGGAVPTRPRAMPVLLGSLVALGTIAAGGFGLYRMGTRAIAPHSETLAASSPPPSASSAPPETSVAIAPLPTASAPAAVVDPAPPSQPPPQTTRSSPPPTRSAGVAPPQPVAHAAPVVPPAGAAPATSPPSDDDAVPDTVMLTKGGRLVGAVMEEDPRKGITIRLLDGTVRHLAPGEFKQVLYRGR